MLHISTKTNFIFLENFIQYLMFTKGLLLESFVWSILIGLLCWIIPGNHFPHISSLNHNKTVTPIFTMVFLQSPASLFRNRR
mgnify:FL=1